MDTTTNRGNAGQGSLNDDRNKRAEASEANQAEARLTGEPGQPGSGQGLDSAAGNYNPAGQPAGKQDRNADFDSQHSADSNTGLDSDHFTKDIGNDDLTDDIDSDHFTDDINYNKDITD